MNGWLTSGSLKIGGELIIFLSSWNAWSLASFQGISLGLPFLVASVKGAATMAKLGTYLR